MTIATMRNFISTNSTTHPSTSPKFHTINAWRVTRARRPEDGSGKRRGGEGGREGRGKRQDYKEGTYENRATQFLALAEMRVRTRFSSDACELSIAQGHRVGDAFWDSAHAPTQTSKRT